MMKLVWQWYLHDHRRSVVAVLLAASAVACALLPPRLVPESLAEHLVDACGLMAIATGATMRLWATLFIGGRKNRYLVTEGPYAVCRHPLYFGSFLILVGLELIGQRVALLLVGVALCVLYRLAIPVEDRRLALQFGPTWEAWRRRVPAFLPAGHRLAEALGDRPPSVTARAVVREALTLIGFIAVAAGLELFEQVRIG